MYSLSEGLLCNPLKPESVRSSSTKTGCARISSMSNRASYNTCHWQYPNETKKKCNA